jgi:hypothetical protein
VPSVPVSELAFRSRRNFNRIKPDRVNGKHRALETEDIASNGVYGNHRLDRKN